MSEASAAGVGPVLAVSMGAVSAERVLDLRKRSPGQVLLGVGLHPSRVPELSTEAQESELRALETTLSSVVTTSTAP